MTNESDIESRLSGLEIKIKGLEQMVSDIIDRMDYYEDSYRRTVSGYVELRDKIEGVKKF